MFKNSSATVMVYDSVVELLKKENYAKALDNLVSQGLVEPEKKEDGTINYQTGGFRIPDDKESTKKAALYMADIALRLQDLAFKVFNLRPGEELKISLALFFNEDLSNRFQGNLANCILWLSWNEINGLSPYKKELLQLKDIATTARETNEPEDAGSDGGGTPTFH